MLLIWQHKTLATLKLFPKFIFGTWLGCKSQNLKPLPRKWELTKSWCWSHLVPVRERGQWPSVHWSARSEDSKWSHLHRRPIQRGTLSSWKIPAEWEIAGATLNKLLSGNYLESSRGRQEDNPKTSNTREYIVLHQHLIWKEYREAKYSSILLRRDTSWASPSWPCHPRVHSTGCDALSIRWMRTWNGRWQTWWASRLLQGYEPVQCVTVQSKQQ